MRLIRGIHNFSRVFRGCALTIGNFDGVHLGHQALLNRLRLESNTLGLTGVVMIFEPHPLELFSRGDAPARLTRFRDKLRYLKECAVEHVLCVHFNRRFASLTASKFISDLLVKCLGVRLLIVGDDFRFGAHREGDLFLLRKASLEYGFKVATAMTFYEDGIRVSSTAIRQALAVDQIELAEKLLGHPFSLSGRVVHGEALGTTIGFPTANILLRRQVTPVKGVYAVDVFGIGNKPFPGVANIGTRPTVLGVQCRLEVHLLTLSMHLYSRYIEVVLRKKIRDEQKFMSFDELKAQISRDVEVAREFFGLKS